MYVGINAGAAKIDSTGFGSSSSSSWSLLGGYAIVENIAAEITYSNFGVQSGPGVNSKNKVISISGVAALPMNEQFLFFAKFGFASTVWDVSGGFSKQRRLDIWFWWHS